MVEMTWPGLGVQGLAFVDTEDSTTGLGVDYYKYVQGIFMKERAQWYSIDDKLLLRNWHPSVMNL